MDDKQFCTVSPCTFIGNPLDCDCEWCHERCQFVNLNQIYTFSALAAHYVPILFAGAPSVVGTDVSIWLFWRSIIEAIPYTATLIVLFIVLIITKVISIEVGILLIVLLALLVIICVAWATQDVAGVANGALVNVNNIFNQNWEANKDDIEDDVRLAILNPDELACTGYTGLFCFLPSCPHVCPSAPISLIASVAELTNKTEFDDEELMEQYRQEGSRSQAKYRT